MVPPELIAAGRRIATSAIGSNIAGGISRWPIAYTSIEPIVCALDIMLIVAASVACGAIYSSLALQSDIDLLRHVATAAVWVAGNESVAGHAGCMVKTPEAACGPNSSRPEGLPTQAPAASLDALAMQPASPASSA